LIVGYVEVDSLFVVGGLVRHFFSSNDMISAQAPVFSCRSSVGVWVCGSESYPPRT
jgi:hypothetical protein